MGGWLEAGGWRVAGGVGGVGGWRAGWWLEAGGLHAAEEGGRWLEKSGWRGRGRWLEGGCRWVRGWLEVAGMVLGGGVAGLVGFGIVYRYRTEPKLRNTGNTYTAKYRIRIGIDRTARLQPC